MSLTSWKRALGVGLLCASLLPVHAYAQDKAPLTTQNNVSFYQMEAQKQFGKNTPSNQAVANVASEAVEAKTQLAEIFSPAFSVYSPEEQLNAYAQFYKNEVDALNALKQNLHTSISEQDLNAYKEQVEMSAIQLRDSYNGLLKSLQAYVDAGADVTEKATNILTLIQKERALIKELTSVTEIKKSLISKVGVGSRIGEKSSESQVELELLAPEDFVVHEDKAYVRVGALTKVSTFTVSGNGGDWTIATENRTLSKAKDQYTLNGTSIGSPAMSHKVEGNFYVQFDTLLSLFSLTFEEVEDGILIKDKLTTNHVLDTMDSETFIKSLKNK